MEAAVSPLPCQTMQTLIRANSTATSFMQKPMVFNVRLQYSNVAQHYKKSIKDKLQKKKRISLFFCSKNVVDWISRA